MPEKNSLLFPPVLLILDIIGTALLGLGLANYVAGVDILPASWRFDHYGPVFIGIGAALMLPFMVHVIKNAAGNKQERHS
ncbi:MAG: hypothetical protein NUV55_11205 [Sulfuricaulis sp.]|uniref:hypothetical protein n=1 Tax=Sulfuricaulis sp. TaxID=2003553 RepID=UPI0025E2B118|nr:hypothetical protein [Sulfuricaulis sp.]MCR4347752.1 hypothetical protein [Sulfuricaulis sp.]